VKTEIEADDDDPGVVHVYPVLEESLHTLDGRGCFCQPDVELFSNGKEVVIHRRMVQ
jgi:hypothetical protein